MKCWSVIIVRTDKRKQENNVRTDRSTSFSLENERKCLISILKLSSKKRKKHELNDRNHIFSFIFIIFSFKELSVGPKEETKACQLRLIHSRELLSFIFFWMANSLLKEKNDKENEDTIRINFFFLNAFS